jgi:hypothetical protein
MTTKNVPSDRDTIGIVLGGKPYVILSYARMRKDWFGIYEYKKFQLAKREFTSTMHMDVRCLVKLKYLETSVIDGSYLYRITQKGHIALKELARRRIEREKYMIRTKRMSPGDAKFKHDDD